MSSDTATPKRFYNPDEAAMLLGLTSATLKRLRLSKQISHFRPSPRCIRFTKEQLDNYLAQSEQRALMPEAA